MPKRTTLTLDDDVIARVEQEVRRTGRSFKSTVNDAIRNGLDVRGRRIRAAIELPTFPLAARPGLALDDIGGLLELVEGPAHR